MESLCCIAHCSTLHNLTSVLPLEQQNQVESNTVEHALKRHLASLPELLLSDVCQCRFQLCQMSLVSNSYSMTTWYVCIILCMLVYYLLFQGLCEPFFFYNCCYYCSDFGFLIFWSQSSASTLVCEEVGNILLDVRIVRLDNTSPPVMIAVSRSRSLYQRLNNDIKEWLAVHSLSLLTSANSTVNLLR